jgi:hypothetical protein
MSRPEDLVLIGTATSEVEATIWRDALEQEGVASFVRNRDPLAPIGVPALFGRFELFVLPRDEKRARWIIGEAAGPSGATWPPSLEPGNLDHASPRHAD